MATAVEQHLSLLLYAGWATSSLLYIVLPYHDREDAEDKVKELLAELQSIVPSVRAGFALWPVDGRDRDTLLATARQAAQEAAASQR